MDSVQGVLDVLQAACRTSVLLLLKFTIFLNLLSVRRQAKSEILVRIIFRKYAHTFDNI